VAAQSIFLCYTQLQKRPTISRCPWRSAAGFEGSTETWLVPLLVMRQSQSLVMTPQLLRHRFRIFQSRFDRVYRRELERNPCSSGPTTPGPLHPGWRDRCRRELPGRSREGARPAELGVMTTNRDALRQASAPNWRQFPTMPHGGAGRNGLGTGGSWHPGPPRGRGSGDGRRPSKLILRRLANSKNHLKCNWGLPRPGRRTG
jgi:hypothetical protein